MSGVAIIKKLLNAATTTQVIAGVIPIGTTLPAIGITQISGKMRDTLAGSESIRLETERIQVTLARHFFNEDKQAPDRTLYARTESPIAKARIFMQSANV